MALSFEQKKAVVAEVANAANKALAAVAAESFASHDDERVIVAQDARMGEVYLAVYSRDPDGLPVAEGDTHLHKVSECITSEAEAGLLAAGAGWQRYPEFLSTNEKLVPRKADVLYPNARYLLGLGASDWNAGLAISPDKVAPEYVRMKVAEKPIVPTQ